MGCHPEPRFIGGGIWNQLSKVEMSLAFRFFWIIARLHQRLRQTKLTPPGALKRMSRGWMGKKDIPFLTPTLPYSSFRVSTGFRCEAFKV